MNGLAVSGEIVTSGTALAGLGLVYIGVLVTSFSGFEATEKNSVKGAFQRRAWLAFVGSALSLIAASLGVIGKAFSNACTANASVIIVLIAFVWTAAITIANVREIK